MLDALGIDNYGINNVVGGIIAFSSLLTGNLAAACSRYITFSLGTGIRDEEIRVFNTTIWVQVFISIVAVLFLEIGGLWFLNTIAKIPEGRIYAANWVFQCSVLSTVLSLICVPYHASIIAHERMSVYAYMSIIDALIKLAICFIVMYYGGDRLILFSSLYLMVSILISLFYIIYGHIKFDEVKITRKIDRHLVKEMFGYSAWSFMSQTTYIMNTQGINMLINAFFGVAFNAARGVAVSVSTYAQSFVGNFTMAFNPQITKSYASGDYAYCYSLVNKGGKFSWYLLLLFAVPVCVEAKTLLSLWLVEVPPMAPLFLQFSMLEAIAIISSQNLLKLIQTTGKLKNYTIKASVFSAVVFPLVWIAYKLGTPVWVSYPIFIVIYSLLIIWRFNALKRISSYNPHTYVVDVLKPCIFVTIISFILPCIIAYLWPSSILRFCILVPISVVYVGVIEYFIGLNSSEQIFIKDKIINLLSKHKFLLK